MERSRLERADEDAVLPITIGTAAWLIVLVVLILRRPALDDEGHGWWLGVAATGFGLGLVGILFLRWRRARLHQRLG